MKETSSESVLLQPIQKLDMLQLAFGDGTPKKAFFTALVVGSILTSINHGDMILSGEYPYWLKIALTYCVPYCVTTWGAITGKLALLTFPRTGKNLRKLSLTLTISKFSLAK